MPVNKRSKYRGSRTCGGGTHKNRRGAGNRGGRGRAGHRDHRFSHYFLLNEIHNGKHGFVNKTGSSNKVIDVGDLDQILDALVLRGVATVDGDIFVIDAEQIGINKILGGGKVTHKMNITAEAYSETAKAKIEAIGGQLLTA